MKKYNEILKESADLILQEAENYTKDMFKGIHPKRRKELKQNKYIKNYRGFLANDIKDIRNKEPNVDKSSKKVYADSAKALIKDTWKQKKKTAEFKRTEKKINRIDKNSKGYKELMIKLARLRG